MTHPPSANADAHAGDFLSGGGVAGQLLRSIDWARTPLGPVEGWPLSLRLNVRALLHSRHPMFFWWGPEHIQFYNDAYIPILGAGRHPSAMGQRGADCWLEVWPIIGPQIEAVMQRAQPSWNEDQLAPVYRDGRLQDAYWTYGYSPLFDEAGGIAGALAQGSETTGRVLAERRLRMLGALSARTASVTHLAELLQTVREVLDDAADDIPFAVLVRPHPATGDADLTTAIRLDRDAWRAIEPAVRAVAAGPAGVRITLPEAPGLPPGAEAFTVSLAAPSFIVFGLGACLVFDDPYREHLTRVAAHLAVVEARVGDHALGATTERVRDRLLGQASIATALLTGPEHRFELASPLYERMVGRRNIVGRTYLEVFPELAATALPGVLDRVYETGEPFAADEYPVALDLLGEGRLEQLYLRFSLEAIRDVRGRTHGIMVVAIDITEHVVAQRVLARSQMERDQLFTALERASRVKDDFLAMLGHELRNPLAPIRNAVHVMQQTGVQEPRVVRAREIIERQVRHMTHLLDDLLDVGRLTSGKIQLRKERLDLVALVRGAVDEHRADAVAAGLTLTVALPVAPLWMVADPTRIEQSVANLLINAVKFTPEGGHVAVRVASEPDGAAATVTVSDDGMGLEPEMLDRLFEPFAQADRSLDRSRGGLGLGLSLVRAFVEMHGGSIAARSDGAGKGAEFTLRLPLEADAPVVVSAPVLPAHPQRVLIVEDNLDAAESMVMLLELAGHEVAVAHTGAAGVEQARSFHPAVVLCDIGLPGEMDGYAVARALRAVPSNRAVRLIALTGYGQEDDKLRAREAGFDEHLTKPIEPATLDRILAVPTPGPGGLS